MRINEVLQVEHKKLDIRELVTELDLPEEFWGTHLGDGAIDWFNRNDPKCINKLLKNPKLALASKLLFWKSQILKVTNYGEPLGTVEDFQKSLQTPITLWRGGEGTFDSNFKFPSHVTKRGWISFTADKRRVRAFSEYNGTAAGGMFLNKNQKYWIIEVTLKLDEILLYLPHGGDEEVILPINVYRNAKVISQT